MLEFIALNLHFGAPNTEVLKTDLQMITDYMPIRTPGTCDQDSTLMVALLGNGVCRAVLAWFAGKGELVSGWFLRGS